MLSIRRTRRVRGGGIRLDEQSPTGEFLGMDSAGLASQMALSSERARIRKGVPTIIPGSFMAQMIEPPAF